MLSKGSLLFCCGLPGSGKSTWALEWAHKHNGRPRAVISGDAFRYALHGKAFVPNAEPTVFSMMDIAARALLHSGFDVLMDETCTTADTLMRYYRLDLNAEPVWFVVTSLECRRRVVNAGKSRLLPVIDRLSGQFETFRNNFADISSRCREVVRSRQEADQHA